MNTVVELAKIDNTFFITKEGRGKMVNRLMGETEEEYEKRAREIYKTVSDLRNLIKGSLDEGHPAVD